MGKKSKNSTENNSDRRKRSKNFENYEIRLLMKYVMNHIEIIEDKTSDSTLWKMKNTTWNEIANAFNGNSEIHRTVETLRLKYETIKKELKKKIIHNKKETCKAGGGVPHYLKLELYEEALLNYISLPANGLVPDNDCKAILPNPIIKREVIVIPESDNFICADNSSCNSFDVPDTIILNQENILSECSTEPPSYIEESTAVSETKNTLPPQTSKGSSEFSKECNENINKNLKRPWGSWTQASLQEERHEALTKNNMTTTRQIIDTKLKVCAESRKELIELQKESVRLEIRLRQEEEKRRVEIHELQKKKLILENQLLKLEVIKKRKNSLLECQDDEFI